MSDGSWNIRIYKALRGEKMIETQRLIIKPLLQEDEGVISELFTDEIVKKTYMLPDFRDSEHLHKYFLRILEISNGSEHYMLGIYLKETGELTGIINDTALEKYELAEVGYALLPRYHNMGYATEALSAMIGYLKEAGYKRIETGAFEDNLASARVMEKCGMKRIEKSEKIQYRGKEHNCIYYSI